MIKNKFFNQKVLKMMIKENIENNKSLFLKDDSKNELIFEEKDFDEMALMLNKRLEGKTNISLDDIDRVIDDFLRDRKYIFDYRLEKKYKKTTNGNYFYFGILEIDYYSADTSLENLIYKVSHLMERNHTRFCKSTKVYNDMVNIHIIKDGSTKFTKDENKSSFKAIYNLKTQNVIYNFPVNEMNKASKIKL